MKKLFIILFLLIATAIAVVCFAFAKLEAITPLTWDLEKTNTPITILMSDPNESEMVQLRELYNLEDVIRDAEDDYAKLRLITGWVQKQWKHNGNNKPSRPDPLTILKEANEGKSFRCVEYARVVAACARALGMPSRALNLKRRDVETAKSGAGHVVAEVWLDQFNKWVFVDGQWGAIPEKDGRPLNAIEFQKSIANDHSKLNIRFARKGNKFRYLIWVAPYLYYFDFDLDQKFFKQKMEPGRISGSLGKIMLVPKGANKPKVFQIKKPITNCNYISNPQIFYPTMNKGD